MHTLNIFFDIPLNFTLVPSSSPNITCKKFQRKIYDYCVSVLFTCYVHDTIYPHTHICIYKMWLFSVSSVCFYSCDFQISISFMSQKCQNLLPLKINSSSVKRHWFVKWVREKNSMKIETYFSSPSYDTHRKSITSTTHTMVDEGSFLRSKKVLTLCRILCGYSLPLLSSLKP